MVPLSIEGKDAPVEETIDRASALLQKLGFEIRCSNWLNPAPNCWSVHVQSDQCPDLYTNGKGITREAAMASGLGEFFERLSTDFFFAEYYLGSPFSSTTTPPFYFHPDELSFTDYLDNTSRTNGHGAQLLTPQLRKLYNPEGELQYEHLLDNNFDGNERGIIALPFKNISTRETVYFPISVLNNLYVSNGMAAGNSSAEASSQALSEIIERYVKNRVIAEGIALPSIPRSALHRLPHLFQLVESLEKEGFVLHIKDASFGGNFPVICVLLVDKKSGGIFAAFGCNCRFRVAIERTLTELLQGRQLKQLRHFEYPSHDMDLVSASYNLESHFIDSDGLLSWKILNNYPDYPLQHWDFEGTTDEEWTLLQSIVRKCGHDIYRAEFNHCGMYSCRLLVPGMSEIYPVDDLVWNNRNQGTELRPQLLQLNTMAREELENIDEQLDNVDFQEDLLVSRVIGVLFDDDSAWSNLRIGELRAMLKLALGIYGEAMEQCRWCTDFAELPATRKRLHQLLHTLLGFLVQGEDVANYMETLSQIYREDEIGYAQKIIRREIVFPGLNFAKEWKDVSKKHQDLLSIYSKIQDNKHSGEFATPHA
jgi:ribosomal protein S12 methylthiotransferase accessory factor